MSILIKGMDMPNDCCQCKLARYDDYENETFCPFTDVMCLSIGRQDNCPLEEVPDLQLTCNNLATDLQPCNQDCISRQAAIDAVEHITSSMSVCVNTDECHGMKRMQRQAVIELANLPSAQPDATRNNDCNGCKFVGCYDTDFPCATCTRKNKDYYAAERREDGQTD